MTEKTAVVAPMPSAMTQDGGDGEAGRARQRPRGVAEVLREDVEMDARRGGDRITQRFDPQRDPPG